MSCCLWPHGLQHTRLPCPSLSPGVCSDSCPLNRWCQHVYIIEIIDVYKILKLGILEFPFCLWNSRFFERLTLFIYLFSFIFISWRLITSQHFSGFCRTLTWISHGVTCIPHPDPPTHLPLHPVPLGLPSAPGPSTCLMHPNWAGDLSHYR